MKTGKLTLSSTWLYDSVGWNDQPMVLFLSEIYIKMFLKFTVKVLFVQLENM